MIIKVLSDKLKVNKGKTEFLIIGTGQQLVAKMNFSSLRIGDSPIYSTDKANNLRFWLDSHMKLEINISKCSSAAFFHLFNIRRIRKFLTYEAVKILVNLLVKVDWTIVTVFFMVYHQFMQTNSSVFKMPQLD